MSMNLYSDSVVTIPHAGLPVAIAVLEEYLRTTNRFHEGYVRQRLAALPADGGRHPASTVAFLFSGILDLPVGFGGVDIDQATGAVVLRGFGVSYEDDDSDDPVSDVLGFFARLAPAVVPGTVVIFTADSYDGPRGQVDYRVELNRPGAPISVAKRAHWVLNEDPWKPVGGR